MTDAQELLSAIIRAGEGTKKAGFETPTNLGVSYTVSQTGDVVTFTGSIPIETKVDSTGNIKISAKDFITSLVITA